MGSVEEGEDGRGEAGPCGGASGRKVAQRRVQRKEGTSGRGCVGGQGKETVVIQPMLGVLREGSIITHVPRGATSGA